MITNSLSIIESFQIDEWPTFTIYQPLKDFLIENNFATPANHIVIAFVPIILSIAYPLLLQSTSRLYDMYKSNFIIGVFESSFRNWFFKWTLRFTTLLTLAGLLFSIELLFIASISVMFLLISFFLLVDWIFIFSNAQKLFLWHLRPLRQAFKSMQDNRSLEEFSSNDKPISRTSLILSKLRLPKQTGWLFRTMENFFTKTLQARKRKRILRRRKTIMKRWHTIIGLFHYAIRNDRDLEYDIKDKYVYPAIQYIKRVVHENRVIVEFPAEIHNSFFEVVRSYIRTGEKDRYQNIDEFVGPIYYSENYGRNAQFLHINTLVAIWRSLVLVIENKRWDVLERYWLLSHQYFRYNFINRLARHYPGDKVMDQVGSDEMIELHQDQFLQIHLTIGAYLLYKSEFATIKKLWNITQSEPPSYFLYPTSIGEIISYFGRHHSARMEVNLLRLWFKDMNFDEMYPNRDVKGYVCEYLVLVFLKLYFLPPSFSRYPLSDFPVIPKSQTEKISLKKNIMSFIGYLERMLKRPELMSSFGFDAINTDFCKTKGIQMPLSFLNQYIIEIDKLYEVELSMAKLAEDKIREIDNNTAKAIKEAFDDISRIKGAEISDKERDTASYKLEAIRGTRMLLDKEALIANYGKLIINSTHLVAQAISRDYYAHFATKVFFQETMLALKVPSGHMFTAIERLNPVPESYSIITFGVNVGYLKDSRNLPIEPREKPVDFIYKGMPIYCFDHCSSFVYNTLYLIRNDQLPMVKHIDWSSVPKLPKITKERWQSMERIDDKLHVYRRERILGNHPELKEEYLKAGKTEEELKYKVEIDVDFIAYIWFKKGTKLIRIKEADPFQEGGNMVSLDDIKPLSD